MGTHSELTSYLRGQGIAYFSGIEVCTVGRNRSVVAPPPVEWWPRIIPALRFAEVLRYRMGHPLIVGNGYRPPEANKAVGGAKFSAHLYFRALDLDLPADKRDWSNRVKFYEEAVRLWAERADEPLGLGLYAKGGGARIHIDHGHKPFPLFKSRRYWKADYVKPILSSLK